MEVGDLRWTVRPKIVETGEESLRFGRYNISNTSNYVINICFMQNNSPGDSVWQMGNPLLRYLPLLAVQLALIITVTRILMFILRPLRQPRFVAGVIAGILLGPSFLGKTYTGHVLFPFESNVVLETFSELGLTYYMFLVGLEMDVSALRKIGKKSLSIAAAGIFFPLVAGAGLYFAPVRQIKDINRISLPIGAAFWAITLSTTSFPDLARLLSDIKLLHTDLGKIALTAALVSDISGWVLYVATVIFFDPQKFYMTAIPTIIFLLFCWFLLRPGIVWMIKHTNKKGDGKFGEQHISFILLGVAICGCITDACGSHSMLGGFMLGLIIPNGELAVMIMERIEEFVNGLMLPGFFLITGFRTNLLEIKNKTNWTYFAQVTISATVAKIVSTAVVALQFGMSLRDSLSLGSLMNTKGVLALLVLNEGRSLKAMDNILMLTMVFIVLFMTALAGPIFLLVSKNTRRSNHYKQRTIERSNLDSELRILTCIHATRNATGIINLLRVSNPTNKSPLSVFAVHLVQLTGRASAMMIVHDTSKTSTGNNLTREKAESEQIIGAFEDYQSGNQNVTVNPFTIVSPYATMHEDIINLAEDKRVAMIVIPFHKQPTGDGELQGENHSIKQVNENLLVTAPCSIGILVDRGLTSSIEGEPSRKARPELHFAMIFIGGPDNHEALSYAWKMAGTPGVTLTVVRFMPSKEAEQNMMAEIENNEDEFLTALTNVEVAKELDDEFIEEFRFQTMCDPSIIYNEKTVNDSDEMAECIATKYSEFDLYIVGRGHGAKSPLTKGLVEWSECPELGPIGETLVSSQSTGHASVLAVQQFPSFGLTSRSQRHKFLQKKWASPILNPHYQGFIDPIPKPNL